MCSISVIVPTYNSAKTLKRCINSLIGADEIIVVNDGSTDDTLHVLERLNIPNIRVFSHKNRIGLYKSRFDGLKLSSKNHILFVDADDKLGKDVILKAKQRLNENFDILQIGIEWRLTTLRLPYRFKNSYDSSLALEACLFDHTLFPVQCWGKFYKRDFLENVIFIDNEYNWGEDRLFNMCVFNMNPRIEVDTSMKYLYTRGNGLSSRKNQDIAKEIELVMGLQIEWCKKNQHGEYISKIEAERDILLKYVSQKGKR